MSEGIRTPDGQIHSLELYRLSYTHHRIGIRPSFARLEGLEPPTHGLEGRCSIHLSYRRPSNGEKSVGHPASWTLAEGSRPGKNGWCAWQDLNLRHLAPEASALSRLSYTRGLFRR